MKGKEPMKEEYGILLVIMLGVLPAILAPAASAAASYTFEWALPATAEVRPAFVVTDSSDRVYVTDEYNDTVWVYTRDGQLYSRWGADGSGNGQFHSPMGMALNSSGYLYIADTYNNRIQVFTRDGTYQGKIGRFGGGSGTGNGEFDEPRGVAIDANDNLLVADTGNHRIQVFTKDGTFIEAWNKSGGGSAPVTGNSISLRACSQQYRIHSRARYR